MISQRRYYLDKLYKDNTEKLKGDVLDIGGKKDNKKGNYRPNSNLKMFF